MNIPFRSYWMLIGVLTLLGCYLPNKAMMHQLHQPSPTTCTTTSYIPSNKLLFTLACTGFFAGVIAHQIFSKPNHTSYYWDWDNIDTTNTKFPADFMWGVGTSAHQVEGNCINNTWSEWNNHAMSKQILV